MHSPRRGRQPWPDHRRTRPRARTRLPRETPPVAHSTSDSRGGAPSPARRRDVRRAPDTPRLALASRRRDLEDVHALKAVRIDEAVHATARQANAPEELTIRRRWPIVPPGAIALH